MEFKKFIAHKIKGASGKPLGCECTETIVCANCVQVNLIMMDNNLQKADGDQKTLIEKIGQVGIRKSARLLGVNPNAVQKWIKNKKTPNWVALKFDFGKVTDHEKS